MQLPLRPSLRPIRVALHVLLRRYYEQFLRGRRGKVIKYWQRQGWKMVYVRSKGHVTKYLQTGGDLNMHQYHAGY